MLVCGAGACQDTLLGLRRLEAIFYTLSALLTLASAIFFFFFLSSLFSLFLIFLFFSFPFFFLSVSAIFAHTPHPDPTLLHSTSISEKEVSFFFFFFWLWNNFYFFILFFYFPTVQQGDQVIWEMFLKVMVEHLYLRPAAVGDPSHFHAEVPPLVLVHGFLFSARLCPSYTHAPSPFSGCPHVDSAPACKYGLFKNFHLYRSFAFNWSIVDLQYCVSFKCIAK